MDAATRSPSSTQTANRPRRSITTPMVGADSRTARNGRASALADTASTAMGNGGRIETAPSDATKTATPVSPSSAERAAAAASERSGSDSGIR